MYLYTYNIAVAYDMKNNEMPMESLWILYLGVMAGSLWHFQVSV